MAKFSFNLRQYLSYTCPISHILAHVDNRYIYQLVFRINSLKRYIYPFAEKPKRLHWTFIIFRLTIVLWHASKQGKVNTCYSNFFCMILTDLFRTSFVTCNAISCHSCLMARSLIWFFLSRWGNEILTRYTLPWYAPIANLPLLEFTAHQNNWSRGQPSEKFKQPGLRSFSRTFPASTPQILRKKMNAIKIPPWHLLSVAVPAAG